MSTPLRVLLIEDCEQDALLILQALRGGGYDATHELVDTAERLRAALASQPWDVVIADHALPHLDGMAALRLVQESGTDLPFILVSGAIGEETAVAAMKAGAHDYVMKDRMSRLAAAVERELREAELRRAHKRAQRALRESEARQTLLLRSIPLAIYTAKATGDFGSTWVSDQIDRISGLPAEKFVDDSFGASRIHPDDRERVLKEFATIHDKGALSTEYRWRCADGSYRWFLDQPVLVRTKEGEAKEIIGTWLDITERKRDEEALQEARRELEKRVQERTAELAQANRTRVRLIQQLMSAQEDEQRRIARDLHDEVGQSITSLLVGLRAVEDVPTLDGTRARLRELRQVAALALEEVRRLARGLRPRVLDDLGLAAALVRHAADFSKAHDIAVQVDAGSLMGTRLPAPVETALYRIVQEALTNVAKHAAAENVRITLARGPDGVEVTVADDGRGSESEALIVTPVGRVGLGMSGMRERAALLRGTVAVDSQPGGGTTVRVRIPVRQENLAEENHGSDSGDDSR